MADTTTQPIPTSAPSAARSITDGYNLTGAAGEALRDAIHKLERHARYLNEAFHDVIVGEQAAWIEWQHGKGAEAAMGWIHNGLAGPGHIPDSGAPFGKEAQAWFDTHKLNAFPTCFCGRPSNQLWMGEGFCSIPHLKQRQQEALTGGKDA